MARIHPARWTREEVAEQLTAILATNDASLLAAVLGSLAREHGMREVAAAAGLSREALYKALRPEAQPRFATINRVCGALGVRLVAKPTNPPEELIEDATSR